MLARRISNPELPTIYSKNFLFYCYRGHRHPAMSILPPPPPYGPCQWNEKLEQWVEVSKTDPLIFSVLRLTFRSSDIPWKSPTYNRLEDYVNSFLPDMARAFLYIFEATLFKIIVWYERAFLLGRVLILTVTRPCTAIRVLSWIGIPSNPGVLGSWSVESVVAFGGMVRVLLPCWGGRRYVLLRASFAFDCRGNIQCITPYDLLINLSNILRVEW